MQLLKSWNVEVEVAESSKSLCVKSPTICPCSAIIDATSKKAHQCYSQKAMEICNVSNDFCGNRHTIESILMGCITPWHRYCPAQDCKKLRRVELWIQPCPSRKPTSLFPPPHKLHLYFTLSRGGGQHMKANSYPTYSLLPLNRY